MNMNALDNKKSSILCPICVGPIEEKTCKKVCTSCEQMVNWKWKNVGTVSSAIMRNGDIIDVLFKKLGRLEISDEKLFQDPPPKEDCPLCFQPMPFSERLCEVITSYMPCCGKIVCCGCTIAALNEMEEGNMKRCCPFCRVPYPQVNEDEEFMKRCIKRMKLGDGEAFYQLARVAGFSNDCKRAYGLYNQAADLGSIKAHYELACHHGRSGCVQDKKKAMYHFKMAAIGGHELARHNLGIIESKNGNVGKAYKHWITSAKAGCDESLHNIYGHITQNEYTNALLANRHSQEEMKSEQRTIAAEKYSDTEYSDTEWII